MIKIPYILPNRRSAKRLSRYAKSILASNLSLAIIALPALPAGLPISTSMPEEVEVVAETAVSATSNLIISEEKLNMAFNIQDQSENVVKTQIPLVYTYMSQGYRSYHPGIDLAAKYGTSIKPFQGGTVKEATYSPFGYGYHVIIDHGEGIESLYAHMSRIRVKKGMTVNIDTEIGLVGMTGHSTGPHLHLEIRRNGIAINPLGLLPAIKTTLLSSK